ncbi:MAG: hypothetical protein KIT20_08040 [Alphaproteobacteria bacterium]|nr:hypothetical protein [Alphaproteobacteria bacterium]
MKHLLAALTLLAALVPAALPAWAMQDDENLDVLFERLQAADGPVEARVVEQAIWQVWMKSDSPTVDLLLGSALKAMNGEDHEKALELLDVVVVLAPDFAEGWNKRATLHYMLGNYDASIADIRRTIALEPRHFGALSGLATILEDRKDAAGAMDALRRALAANPHIPNGKEKLRDLTRRARGDPI